MNASGDKGRMWAHVGGGCRGSVERFLVFILLGGMTICSAALADERDYHPEVDIWPIFYYNRSLESGASQIEALWPFFERSDSPESTGWYFRPLYNSQTDKSRSTRLSEFFYPLGFGTHTPDVDRVWFFPLFLTERELRPGTFPPRTDYLLPLLVNRRLPDGRRDFMLFPIFGVLHNWQGRDKVILVLWPLFTLQLRRQDEKDTEAETRHYSVLRPLFAWVSRHDGGGWKFWPIYGRTIVRSKSEKIFVLWPFYNRQHLNLESGGAFRVLLVWPFWGAEDSPAGRVRSVLWPFFSHIQNFRRDHPTKISIDKWELPWPFLGWTTGEAESGHRLWPLWTYERKPNQTALTFLWPIIWYNRESDASTEKCSFRLVPLIWALKERQAGQEHLNRLFQLWPLMKREAAPDGGVRYEVLSLMPVRTREGWERNFAPFFRLYEYRRNAAGEWSHRVFWRLIRVERWKNAGFTELWPICSFYRRVVPSDAEGMHSRADELEFRMLKGLIGYHRSEKERTFRVLFFFNLKLGNKTPHESKAATEQP